MIIKVRVAVAICEHGTIAHECGNEWHPEAVAMVHAKERHTDIGCKVVDAFWMEHEVEVPDFDRHRVEAPTIKREGLH